ncbi:MAG: phenylalanine--tRNA ligase subunit alpha [Candidatus Micrarchaeaceae archaeon]
MDETKLLSFIKLHSPCTLDAIEKNGFGLEEATKLLDRFEAKGIVEITRSEYQKIQLTEEGKRYLEKGFPEEELLKELEAKDVDIQSINPIALGWAKKNGWVSIDGKRVKITDAGRIALKGKYEQKIELEKIVEGNEISKNAINVLEKRGLIEAKKARKIESIAIKKSIEEGISQLTREMLKTGSWKSKSFKSYSIDIEEEKAYPARLHPLHLFINRIRSIWISKGFTEIRNSPIESSFWNFDALFVPQNHPAREMQDTFYLSNPKELDIEESDSIEAIRKLHVKNWKNKWSESLARRGLLRTQTTAATIKYLKKHHSSRLMKFFTVDRVFRNESMDFKHAAEFYQSDGMIVGDNLGLANLKEVLNDFFAELGIEIKIKPSYFPFVEPGLEGDMYDEERGAYIEMVGGGVLRKEIAKAFGIDKTVLAWGIGIDRLLLKQINLENINDLYKNDIDWLRNVESIGI